ncbi:DUF3072 domain-containing protein [Mucilaginibacter arboris]|uniref:DUF3072 domain-containing protein n=1 Tax=Mucilaginibacter arboris TaxID=2682090 RepID=A0A7K1SY77_9SPHI|nr:DUF3072 domain-containing protein [Mucilaginibacter arboris]MVN22276.1 DUF3072 domain-containing protein [Mucilaginibacter arboris]
MNSTEKDKQFDQDKNNTPDNSNSSTDNTNTIKDPDTWTTGDEPMTGAQHSYLKTLSDQAGEQVDETLNKAEASKKIDELQHKTGRGLEH